VDYAEYIPVVGPLFKLMKTVWIPHLELGVSTEKIQNTHKAIQKVVEGLRKGDKFCISPSGKLRSSGKEVIGGASLVYRVLQECPDVQIVVVRIRGLWGSLFSRPIAGFDPSIYFLSLIWKGIWILLKNGIFFCPRRPVDVEISIKTQEFPKLGTRWAMNRYLERWYNNYPGGVDSEPIQLVSYSFWCEDLPKVIQPPEPLKDNFSAVSEEVREVVYPIIRSFLDDPNMEIKVNSNLSTDLGLDSLDVACLATELVKGVDIKDLHVETFVTVRDVLEFYCEQEEFPYEIMRSEALL
jgi:long-chain-fatty-acid--[acyl-carrier-protein] ligase